MKQKIFILGTLLALFGALIARFMPAENDRDADIAEQMKKLSESVEVAHSGGNAICT